MARERRIRFNCVVMWLRGAAHKETWTGRCVLTAAPLIASVPEKADAAAALMTK